MRGTELAQSAGRALDVLNVLLPHFAHGLAPGDIVKATGLPPSAVTRYVATLEEKGFAERITETGRIRPSTRFAGHALGILRSIDSAKARLDEISLRISKH